MTLPDDLPHVIDWRMKSRAVVLTSLPRRPVEHTSSNGQTNAAVVRPTIPVGADGWRVRDGDPWRPLDQLPPHWLPFLNRARGTSHDPRAKLDKKMLELMASLDAAAQGEE
jgi:hypothetical protein